MKIKDNFKNEIKNRIKDNSGMAGVLVVFLMFVVLTIASLALLNAKANLEFSEKSREWREMFYELDSEAQQFLRYIDNILVDAEEFAELYMLTGGYMERNYNGVPTDLQRHITRLFDEAKERAGSGENFDIKGFGLYAKNYLYLYFANKEIWDNQESFFRFLIPNANTSSPKNENKWQSPEISTLTLSDGNIISDLKIEASFFGSATTFILSVKIDVNPLSQSASSSAELYLITEWLQR